MSVSRVNPSEILLVADINLKKLRSLPSHFRHSRWSSTFSDTHIYIYICTYIYIIKNIRAVASAKNGNTNWTATIRFDSEDSTKTRVLTNHDWLCTPAGPQQLNWTSCQLNSTELAVISCPSAIGFAELSPWNLQLKKYLVQCPHASPWDWISNINKYPRPMDLVTCKSFIRETSTIKKQESIISPTSFLRLLRTCLVLGEFDSALFVWSMPRRWKHWEIADLTDAKSLSSGPMLGLVDLPSMDNVKIELPGDVKKETSKHLQKHTFLKCHRRLRALRVFSSKIWWLIYMHIKLLSIYL